MTEAATEPIAAPATETDVEIHAVERLLHSVEQMIASRHTTGVTLTAEQIATIRRHATMIAHYAEEMREP